MEKSANEILRKAARITHVICVLLLLLPSVVARADEPQLFDAATIAKQQNKTAILVDDSAMPGHQVLQMTDKVREIFAFAPKVSLPGLYRVTLRMKMTNNAMGTVTMHFSSGTNVAGNPHTFTDIPQPITEAEFPVLNTWVDISRNVRITEYPKYWASINGGWAGLQIDHFTLVRVTEPSVVLQSIRTNKLRYGLKETGTVNVKLTNVIGTAQTVRVTVQVENGLAETGIGMSQDVALPAAAALTDTNVSVQLPHLAEYGNAVTVRLYQGKTLLDTQTEYCFCTDRPLQLGQYRGCSFPNDYTCDGIATEQFDVMRFTYMPIMECDFWAPCDSTNLAPTSDKWWSGQTLMRLGKEPLKQMIAQGHQQGLTFIAYADRWGTGNRVFDFGRKHPDLVQWYIPKNNFLLSYSVKGLDRESRENDDDWKNHKVWSAGILTPAWGNPEAVALHIKTLQDSLRMFDWDGFRYDNSSPVIDEVQDVFGRKLPMPGWDHAKCIAALRDGPHQVKPSAIYGNNTGWNVDMESAPSTLDPYTQQVRDGGMIMAEGLTGGAIPHKSFREEAHNYFWAGYNAQRFGGQQYNIIDYNLGDADHFYQAVLTLVGSCHICYGVRDGLRPVMQLVCRHGDLFYGDGLRFALDPQHVVQVTAPPQVLWRDYVRYRQISTTHRVYLVHLINLPPAEKMGEAKNVFPDAVNDIATSWTLPEGWQATKAWQITADGGYHKNPLTVQTKDGHVVVTLPQLRRWSVVALDATGPALPLEPTLSPMNDKPSYVGTLDSPNRVFSNSSHLDHGPLDLFGATMHYYPDDPYQLRLGEYEMSNKFADEIVVDDHDAADGKALRLAPDTFKHCDIGFGPAIPGPGRYRITLRVKTLVSPPANGQISGHISSSANDLTPGTKSFSFEFQFPASAIPAVNQWTVLSVEGNLGYPNIWGGFNRGCGWPGLLVDTLSMTRVRPLTHDEQVDDVLAPNRWPDTLGLNAHDGLRVWYGAGLYYQQYHLEDALAAVGAKVDIAPANVFRGAVSFEDVPFPKSPDELAGYDMVIIADTEARFLTPPQQQWLEQFVHRGGRALFLGGPYGFGCGGWDSATLIADMLPVTLHKHDLVFVGKDKPTAIAPTDTRDKSTAWSVTPTVLWMHDVAPKPGAHVQATAADKPAIVTGAYGAGKVGVVTLTPLGDPPADGSPFWNWPAWPQVMTALVKGLLPQK